MKVILIVLDGVADRSQAALAGMTPLEAAELPNLDALTKSGACGHMYPVAPGICPSSDIAHWHMLGYGGYDYPGRASIEAAGAGVELSHSDVVFRVNLATTKVENGSRYVQVAPSYLAEDQAEAVYRSLSEYRPACLDTRLFHLGGPFMVLVLSGGASPMVTESDPLFYRHPVTPIVPLAEAGRDDAAATTADELARFSDWAAGVLKTHPVNKERAEEGMPPVNFVLIKWPSVPPDVPAFFPAWGFRASAVATGIFYRGLARVLDMSFASAAGSEERRRGQPGTEGAGEDLAGKLEVALETLEGGHDFVFVHTKAPDEASHTGRPSRKVRVLEALDNSMEPLGVLLERDPDLAVVITADHATPSGGSDEVIHSGESVPVLMLGRNIRVDRVERFDEVSCAAGSIGLIRGSDIMPLILNLADRARFANSRMLATDVPYRPVPPLFKKTG